ncbi:MAG TPA: hypothetical protein VG052_03400, partial [Puia sp.]|nr:hypothetical protein [Puia sp.]
LPGYLDAVSSGCAVGSDEAYGPDGYGWGGYGLVVGDWGIDLDFVFGWGGWYGRHYRDWADRRSNGGSGKWDGVHGGWRGERRERIDGRWVAVNSQGTDVRRGVTALRGVTPLRGVTRLGQSGSRGQGVGQGGSGRPAGTSGFTRSVSYGGSRPGSAGSRYSGGGGGTGGGGGGHTGGSSGGSSGGGGGGHTGGGGGGSTGGGGSHH